MAEPYLTQYSKVFEYFETHFELPQNNLPYLENQEPAYAAELLRTHWDIESTNVQSLINFIEGQGVRVFAHCGPQKTTQWFFEGNNPFLAVNTNLDTDLLRYEICCALGEMVLYRNNTPEYQADKFTNARKFATNFLLPKKNIPKYKRNFTLKEIYHLKSQWGIPTIELINQLYKMKILDTYTFKKLHSELIKPTSDEPKTYGREKSRFLQYYLDTLRGIGINKSDISKITKIPLGDLNQMFLGLTITSII